jgi:tight adherence protein B
MTACLDQVQAVVARRGRIVTRPLDRVKAVVAHRRRDAVISSALPDVLDRVAGGLRAGAGAVPSLSDAAGAADLPEDLSADLGRVIERAEERGIGPALEMWAGECPLPAVAAAAAALEVAVTSGGPAAPALEGLAAGLRDRHDAAAELSALSAQARLSAVVVGAAPFVSLALSLLADGRVAPTLLGTPAGRTCLLAGVALEALAALWMHRIVRFDS